MNISGNRIHDIAKDIDLICSLFRENILKKEYHTPICPQIYKFLLIYPNLFGNFDRKEYFCSIILFMGKNNWIKRSSILIAMSIPFIGIIIWWRAPILYGEWNKQTLYVSLIDAWYGKSKDFHAHAMWIDDDGGDGIIAVNRISDSLGIKPVYAIIPEKTPQHLIDSLILWQSKGAGIVLHGLRHERWKDWNEQQIVNDIDQSYTKLQESGFDTAETLKIIVPPHACNTKAIRKVIKEKRHQMVTGASLVNPDRNVFQLGRIAITPETDTTEIRHLLEKSYQRNNYVIFGTHSSLPGAFSEEKTIKVLKIAKKMGFVFDFNH